MNRKPVAVKTRKGYAVMHESGIYFLDNDADLNEKLSEIEKRRRPEINLPISERDRLAKAIIFLSSDCNLRCIYCYASSGEVHRVVSADKAKALIDFVADKCDRLILDFHGGGEPLIHFDLIKELHDYAASTKKLYRTTLITNGAITDDRAQKLDWILKNVNNMAVSCDGFPALQNKNRPFTDGSGSSQAVEDTIKFLLRNDFDFIVRSTITDAAAEKLLDITKYFCNLGVKYLVYSPCYNFGRSDDKALVPHADIYAENYMRSVEYACARNVRITSTSFRYPGYHYCGALSGFNIALTVDGFISACYEVTANENGAAGAFIVGQVTDKGVELFKDKILNMRRLEDLSLSKCAKCPYRLVCRGGCPVKKVRNSADSLNNLCQITRALVPRLLDFLQANPQACEFVLKGVKSDFE